METSCTAPRLAVLCEALLARVSTHPLVVPATNGPVEKTVRLMGVVPCAPVPTCTWSTAHHGADRRRSIDRSEATNNLTWSPANLGPGEIHFRITMYSHLLFLSSFADLERISVAATTKGHQQTWGQVSSSFNMQFTHIRFLSFADSEGRSVATTTKGHQQTWGQVSSRLVLRFAHILLVFFAGSERRAVAETTKGHQQTWGQVSHRLL